jgi:hypothetical protein
MRVVAGTNQPAPVTLVRGPASRTLPPTEDRTAARETLDELRMQDRAWRRAPRSGKSAAQAAFVEAVKRATAVSGSPEDKLEPVKYQSLRMLRKA